VVVMTVTKREPGSLGSAVASRPMLVRIKHAPAAYLRKPDEDA
jgi:hypothetical protein